MSNFTEKLGYVRGLMDGLKLNRDDDTIKILDMIVDILGEVSDSINQLENDQQELNDYVESIDDDLADLEEDRREDLSDDYDDEDDYDIQNDDVPARRSHGKLSVLRASESNEDDEDEADDEDDDEVYIGCVCPKCGRLYTICNPEQYDDDQEFECPYCHASNVAQSMNLESIPLAKPVVKKKR